MPKLYNELKNNNALPLYAWLHYKPNHTTLLTKEETIKKLFVQRNEQTCFWIIEAGNWHIL